MGPIQQEAGKSKRRRLQQAGFRVAINCRYGQSRGPGQSILSAPAPRRRAAAVRYLRIGREDCVGRGEAWSELQAKPRLRPGRRDRSPCLSRLRATPSPKDEGRKLFIILATTSGRRHPQLPKVRSSTKSPAPKIDHLEGSPCLSLFATDSVMLQDSAVPLRNKP